MPTPVSMPRTDFYILAESSSPSRFACSIANKAWQQGNSVHIAALTREEAAKMDDLLWTFHDISFLPHALIDDAQAEQTSITIGWPGATCPDREVLINLTGEIPDFSKEFDRIVEIVAPEEKQGARERYKRYRDMGFELHSHDMNAEKTNV